MAAVGLEPSSFSNTSLLPSAKDLLLVVPRLAQRAGAFALHIPEAMDNIAGIIWNGGSFIADATGKEAANSTITNTSAAFAESTVSTLNTAFSQAWREGGESTTSSLLGFTAGAIGRLKNFGGIFAYLTSRWALATFTAAIILNRTQFYASSREHLNLRWHVRLAIYLIPIVAFLSQLLRILQALKCQTSPDSGQIRYGDSTISVMWGGTEGGFLYNVASTLLFWQDDTACCAARHMSLYSVDGDRSEIRGSMSLLFWFFITLCIGQFFETLSCALQGKQVMPETGMTIFEHSLAFAECEAMISNALGFGFFGLPKMDVSSSSDSDAPILSRGEILQRLSVPPEVLLVCVISCISHLSSATLAVIGIRQRVRLVNTAIWALCYMSAFVWSFVTVIMRPSDSIDDLGVLRFPTVCIVGFIPHILILVGIVICGSIYGLALIITAISVPEDLANDMSFAQRLGWAYRNLQANVQFSSSSSIRIKMSEDFYTALLKIGFSILTAASEAVYLNEGSRIKVAQMTYLEQRRIDELASNIDKRNIPSVPSELLGEGIARGVGFADHQNAAIGLSPYARERKSKAASGQSDRPHPGEIDSGLGLSQRRSRMQLTFDFVAGILRLVTSVQAHLLLNVLNRLRLDYRPAWLLKAAGVAQRQSNPPLRSATTKREKRDFWMVGEDGRLTTPTDDEVDVEAEIRRRLQNGGNFAGEDALDEQLYSWWRGGGWFGNVDSSGDYVEHELEDDVTSMISMSTNTSTFDDRSDAEDSGRRTPTQNDPQGRRSREGTPTVEELLDMGSLARLLNPESAAEREEARLLSYSLQSRRPMTRGQYRRNIDRSKAQLVSGLRKLPAHIHSEEEEERDLEQFILAQRTKLRAKDGKGGTWESGAEGMGESGPQCVVCQSMPRTILVWPCGCLSMCDDCRVGLAARNYSSCICCRTNIAAYSRLYVP